MTETMKHFKLRTDLTIKVGLKTLYRIEATKEITKFGVKVGDLGGYIEKEENLSGDAWVSGDARVSGDACVSGDAWVSGNAEVHGDALVYGNAKVYGNAWVSGNAKVYGNAEVYGDAEVSGNAEVSGDAEVYCDAEVHGDALVYGYAKVYGYAEVCGNAEVYGDAWVSGKAKVYGNAEVSGNAKVYGDKIEKENDLINITSNIDSYNITITPKHIKIGCQYHSKTAWFNFTDDEIVKMDGEEAVNWWKTWKPILKAICDGLKQ